MLHRHRHAPGSRRVQHGFSLVEIALVVVVAGFLVTASFFAREMLATMRAKALARQMVAVRLAIDTYQVLFRAMPGDDPLASRNVPGATVAAGAGNGLIDGAWNTAGAGEESMLLWQHLGLAGLMPLPADSQPTDARPRHVAGGYVGASAATPAQRQVRGLEGTLQVCADAVPGRLAKLVDRILDDGDTETGSVRIVPQGAVAGTPAVPLADVEDGAAYVICLAH